MGEILRQALGEILDALSDGGGDEDADSAYDGDVVDDGR